MTRKEFIKNTSVLGMGLPFLSALLNACEKEDFSIIDTASNYQGKVIVVGAGAAGITAGYLLQRQGIDFQILEASSIHGGRVKKMDGFADFPIDLGAEWIHTNPSILAELLDDPNVDAKVDIIKYRPQTYYFYNNGELKRRNFVRNFYGEHKFKNSTWFDYFDQYMIPSFQEKIIYNSPVAAIDYSGGQVKLSTTNGQEYAADKVLITVPLTILQQNFIQFSPALPNNKVEAIQSITMPAGLKMFIEFSECFYPDMLIEGTIGEFLAGGDGDRIFYNAAFRKEANRHVLGLFTVGEVARRYTDLDSNDAIFNKVMEELDTYFDGKASQHYVQHIIQNWSAEPYIRGSYSYDYTQNRDRTISTILEPINNQIYFAGEALNYYDSSTVHGAAQTAYQALEVMFE